MFVNCLGNGNATCEMVKSVNGQIIQIYVRLELEEYALLCCNSLITCSFLNENL